MAELMCVDFVQCLCQLSRPTPTSFWTGIFGSGAFIKGIMKFWFSLSSQGSGRAVRIRHNLGVVLRSCGVSNNYFRKSMRSQLHKTCILGWYWSLGCCVVTRLSKSELFRDTAWSLDCTVPQSEAQAPSLGLLGSLWGELNVRLGCRCSVL